MKKISLIVLPVLTILLEALPLGAVCIFAPSPTERITETFSYFSLIPFGYANFSIQRVSQLPPLPHAVGLGFSYYHKAHPSMMLCTGAS